MSLNRIHKNRGFSIHYVFGECVKKWSIMSMGMAIFFISMLREFDGMDWKGFSKNRESGFRNSELVFHTIMWK